MRPAFGTEADPRGSADDNEFGLRVGRVNKGVERPTHKRIVDRANREQGLPIQLVSQAKSTQGQKQISLGDAEFYVFAGRVLTPVNQQRNIRLPEIIRHLTARIHSDLVNPAAQIG